jgi:transporter family-2 protein
MSISLILLALSLGAIISIYLPMISQTARIMGDAPLANVPFFGIAFLASVAIAFASGTRLSDFGKVMTLPPVLLTAGIMSAGLIIGSSYLVPRIGIGAFFVLLVAGQVMTAMVFGQFGLFGAPVTTLTFGKIAGAAMVVGGVWLVTYR